MIPDIVNDTVENPKYCGTCGIPRFYNTAKFLINANLKRNQESLNFHIPQKSFNTATVTGIRYYRTFADPWFWVSRLPKALSRFLYTKAPFPHPHRWKAFRMRFLLRAVPYQIKPLQPPPFLPQRAENPSMPHLFKIFRSKRTINSTHEQKA